MRKRFFHQKLWLAAAIGWMLFIWSNSMQTAAESSQQSSGVLEVLLPLLSWTGLPAELWHTLIRKMAHMTEFALLGLFWTASLSSGRSEVSDIDWKSQSVVLVICLLTALVDETIQLFVPGRSGEILDVWIDSMGALMGVVGIILAKCIKR